MASLCFAETQEKSQDRDNPADLDEVQTSPWDLGLNGLLTKVPPVWDDVPGSACPF